MARLTLLIRKSIKDSLKHVLPKKSVSIGNILKIIFYVFYLYIFFNSNNTDIELNAFNFTLVIVILFVVLIVPTTMLFIFLNFPSVYLYSKIDEIFNYVDSVVTYEDKHILTINNDLTFNYRKLKEQIVKIKYSRETLEYWLYYLESTKLKIALVSTFITSLAIIYLRYFENSIIFPNESNIMLIKLFTQPSVQFMFNIIGFVIIISAVTGKIYQINYTKERINLIIRIKSN